MIGKVRAAATMQAAKAFLLLLALLKG